MTPTATVAPNQTPPATTNTEAPPQPTKSILDNAPVASNYEWRPVRASMAVTRNEVASLTKQDSGRKLHREGSDKILASPRNRPEQPTSPTPRPPPPKPPAPRSTSAPVEENKLSDGDEKRKSVKGNPIGYFYGFKFSCRSN